MSAPVFHESRRANAPTDTGLFWEMTRDELEADRAARLDSINKLVGERDHWIARYNELDRIRVDLHVERDRLVGEKHAIAHERDLLMETREKLTREQAELVKAYHDYVDAHEAQRQRAEVAERKLAFVKGLFRWHALPTRLKRMITRRAGVA